MKATIFPLKKKVLVTMLLCGFLGFLQIEHVVGQQVSVNPDAYQQEFLGTGASCGLYIGHYMSMSESNRLEASRMLFQDLKLNYIKNYESDYPWVKPGGYDNITTAINNARIYNPDVKVMICAHNLPNHLELGGDTPENVKGEHDPTIPGIMDSIANYYFQICKGYYDRGVTIDIFEPENENGYKETVTDLFDIAVDKFRAIMNDPTINTQNIPMPLIGGPSPWCACAPKTFINGWKADRPNAWNNVDIVTTHGYQLGTQASYQETFDVAEGKLFYQSEQTAKLQQDEVPGVDVIAEQFPNSDPPRYVYNAVIARHMADFFNGGGNAFFHFLTNNPGGTNPALLGTRWNKFPITASPYYGFKHLSATHPLHSKRVSRDLTNMNDFKVVSFRKPGEDTVYVHVVNLYNTTNTVSIDFKTYGIKSAQVWITDETHTFGEIVNETYAFSRDKLFIEATPYSVHTAKVVIDPAGYPTWIKVDDRDASISYEPGWNQWNGNPGYLGTETYCETAGRIATFTFTGIQARYYGFIRKDLGYADIYVDDVFQTTIDCYNPTRICDAMLYESETLTEGTHTLKVAVNGNSNPASTGFEVICDAFEYFSAGDIISREDFESGWGIWNDGGTDCQRNNNATYASSGSYSIRLIDNTSTSVVTTNSLDLSAYNQLKVDFSYWPRSMDNSGEDFWLQVSTDGGSSYTTVEEWNYSDEFFNGQRYYESVTISTINFTNNTRIRFRCDASGNQDYVYLDDIVLTAYGSGAQAAPVIPNEKSIATNIAVTNEIDVSVYPNPVEDILFIKGIDEATTYRIINTTGALVLSGIDNQINVSGLNKGMYLLQIEDRTIRFIKK